MQYEQELRQHVPDTFKHDSMKARLATLQAQKEKERQEVFVPLISLRCHCNTCLGYR